MNSEDAKNISELINEYEQAPLENLYFPKDEFDDQLISIGDEGFIYCSSLGCDCYHVYDVAEQSLYKIDAATYNYSEV